MPATVDTRGLDRLVESWDKLLQRFPEEKRSALDRLGRELLQRVRREIGGSGKVAGWQAPHLGSEGGYVADTPGFASLDMARAAAIPKENLELAFPDIARLFGQCRFTGCSHLTEVGCAVREAVQKGEISRTRYESYAALYEEAKEQEKR